MHHRIAFSDLYHSLLHNLPKRLKQCLGLPIVTSTTAEDYVSKKKLIKTKESHVVVIFKYTIFIGFESYSERGKYNILYMGKFI